MNGQAEIFPELPRLCLARSSTPCQERRGETCVCSFGDDDGHRGAFHLCANCGQRFLPRAPSGPRAARYSPIDGEPAAYVSFMAGDVGRVFWLALLRAAQKAVQTKGARFSTRTFLARYRDDEHVRINDHFSPWLADALIRFDSRLEPIVERRRRTKEALP